MLELLSAQACILLTDTPILQASSKASKDMLVEAAAHVRSSAVGWTQQQYQQQ